MKKLTIKATLAALMAQVIFGFSFMFTKIALGYASVFTVIADRYIIAFIALTVFMLLNKTKFRLSKKIWKLVLMSLFQPILYFLFESYGIKMTTSGFSSVMISLIPVVSMLSGIVFLKEIPSSLQYGFTALSVLGVTVITLSSKADGAVSLLGILLLFGAVISSVAYNIMSRKISNEFGPLERTYAMTLIGLLVFVFISVIENIHNPINVILHFKDLSYTTAILYLGVVSSVIAFLLLNYANTYLPVAKTTVFSNITTVISVIAGILFLDEKFDALTVISTIMIVVGVWGVQVIDVKKKN